MAHVKAGGTSKNGRDSQGQRLGVKLFGGQACKAGNILIRQRGFKWRPGDNTKVGKDDTIYATATGTVQFSKKVFMKFNGSKKLRTVVNVVAA